LSYRYWRAHVGVLSLWAALILALVLQAAASPQSPAGEVLVFITWPLLITCCLATLLGSLPKER
jgi:fumarate reductase subunit C